MVAAMEHDSKIFPVKKFIRMSEDMAADISQIRHDSRIASESETIRRALAIGLAALGLADGVLPEPLLSDEMAARVAKCRGVKQHRSENETIRWLLKAALDGFDKQQAAKG